MNRRQVTVTILCEDRQQEVMARYFLQKRGFTKPFRVIICPKGKQSGEQYVRQNYAREVKAYRSQSNYRSVCLVVVIDADRYKVVDRLNQLNEALEDDSQERRQDSEKIALFVPKRNIETWIHYLQGEQIDEENAYPKLPRESDCKPFVEKLADHCRSGLDRDAPPSLQTACGEWQRILLP